LFLLDVDQEVSSVVRRRFAIILGVLAAVVVASTLWLAFKPEPWRPDTHTSWPPTPPAVSEEEAKYLPPDFTPGPPQTHVIWVDYRPGLKQDVDSAGDAGDCVVMGQLFQEALVTETPDALALTYISRWGKHLRCPQFTDNG
jgi:hypothetical protein